MNNHKILRMKDPSDSYVIDKSPLDSVPFRMIICGKSGGFVVHNLVLLVISNTDDCIYGNIWMSFFT